MLLTMTIYNPLFFVFVFFPHLQRIDPVSLLVEVILEKHDHTEARSSNFVCSSNYWSHVFVNFLPVKPEVSPKACREM